MSTAQVSFYDSKIATLRKKLRGELTEFDRQDIETEIQLCEESKAIEAHPELYPNSYHFDVPVRTRARLQIDEQEVRLWMAETGRLDARTCAITIEDLTAFAEQSLNGDECYPDDYYDSAAYVFIHPGSDITVTENEYDLEGRTWDATYRPCHYGWRSEERVGSCPTLCPPTPTPE